MVLIYKKVFKDGVGFIFSGYIEFLVYLVGVECVVMMLVCESLCVVLIMIYIFLYDVFKVLIVDFLEEIIWIIIVDLMEKFSIFKLCVVVFGLNFYVGEGGVMGYEDVVVIVFVV